MTLFRLFLALWVVTIVGYTAITVTNHGLDLFGPFFGDMAKMGWPGQFNLDFMGMLSLSGLWIAWRHRFSASGLALGLLAFLGGMPFLSSYLLYHSARPGADVPTLLLGDRRGSG